MYKIDKKWYLEEKEYIKVYDINEIPFEFNLRCMRTFYIPTQIVIKDVDSYVPIQARYWEIDRWLYEGQIVTYEFLQKLPNFRGYGNYTQLYIIELWEDVGDDGHIEQRLAGYALTDDTETIIKEMRKECW